MVLVRLFLMSWNWERTQIVFKISVWVRVQSRKKIGILIRKNIWNGSEHFLPHEAMPRFMAREQGLPFLLGCCQSYSSLLPLQWCCSCLERVFSVIEILHDPQQCRLGYLHMWWCGIHPITVQWPFNILGETSGRTQRWRMEKLGPYSWREA